MIEVRIHALGHLGDGVARHNGEEVFVPFALPGETVSGVLDGNRIENPKIQSPVADRIKPACRHFRTCGGCTMQHARDEVLAAWKLDQVKTTLAQSGLETEFRTVITSPPHSRSRAVFSGRRSKSGTIIGFHRRGSEALIDLLECPLVTPKIWAAIEGLRPLVLMGASRKAEVRLTVTDADNGVDVDVSDAKELTPQQQSELGLIATRHGFSRITWNGEVAVQAEPPFQTFGRAQVVPPPGAFLQATQDGEQALLSAVTDAVGDAGRIADLFAGCGTFALPLAEQADILAVEGEEPMIEALLEGWRKASGLHRVEGVARDLFRRPLLPDEFKGIDAVVIDPPRAGALAQITELAKSPVNRIAFVSCNPATFARDARILTEAGFTLDWVQVVDQFRWSAHVELAAQLTRA